VFSRGKAAALAAAIVSWVAAGPANAGPTSPSTAIVSLGDSYISGEAGRWNGNTNEYWGDRNFTDRACDVQWWGGCSYNYDRVYLEGTYDNGCHRSDVAEIRTASISVNAKVNLSCSGAVTSNLFRTAAGGTTRNGEAPQADRLSTIARDYNVRLIAISIGGNDLGFSDIIVDCTVDWSTSSADDPDYCQPENQAMVDSRMPAAMANVRKVIDEVRAVMTSRGYTGSQYRIVLQSYPSPIPRGAENRYPETGWSRLDTGGCPFWNRDSDWARNSLVAQISNSLKGVALAKGVQFMDLRDMLQGREVCSRTTQQVGSGGPSPTTAEWVRFLNSGCCQGDAQESLHPNAYAQRALGRCLTLIWAKASNTHWSCRNTAGQSYTAMTLTQVF